MASEEIGELAKRRGFFGSNGAYGGTAGFYTFGPQGAALKKNVEDAWRDRFTIREGNREIEAPTIMPEAVFEASGHLEGFDDMLVECPECGESHRADHLVEAVTEIEDAEALPGSEVEELIADNDIACPSCGTPLAGVTVEDFNLMFATDIGPGDGQPGYLRPETAQGIFVEFPRLKEYARGNLPFGITQIGPAYRNEISPRGGLLRLREFTQAELEQFIDPEEDEPPLDRVRDVSVRLYPATEQQAEDGEYVETTIGEAVDEEIIGSPWVGYYLGVAKEWYDRIGVDLDRFRFRQHLAGERAHYASDCWDAESEVDGDWIEIAGFSYRADYDLETRRRVRRRRVHRVQALRRAEDGRARNRRPRHVRARPRIRRGRRRGRRGPRNPRRARSRRVRQRDGVGRGERRRPDRRHRRGELLGRDGDRERRAPHAARRRTVLRRGPDSPDPAGARLQRGRGRRRGANVPLLEPEVAPQDAAVFPLVTNDDRLTELADRVAADLREAGVAVAYDDSGSIGRRYRRQDEIGTPFCVTIDRDGIEGDGPETVTVRERDSAVQVRVPPKKSWPRS